MPRTKTRKPRAARANVVLLPHAGCRFHHARRIAAGHAHTSRYRGQQAILMRPTGFSDWAYQDTLDVLEKYGLTANMSSKSKPPSTRNCSRRSQRILNEAIALQGEKEKFSQAASVTMAPDGAVRAIVGGKDYEESQFNRATDAERQSGSAFKPFVYLAALRAGWKPDQIVVDGPV